MNREPPGKHPYGPLFRQCYSFGGVALMRGGSGMLDRLAEFSDWLFSEAVTPSALKTLTSTLRFWVRAAAVRPLATG